MFFKKRKLNSKSKTFDVVLNDLMSKTNDPKDKALIAIAIQVKNLSNKLYDIADPLKGYTKGNPEKVLEYLNNMEKELNAFLEKQI